MTASPANILIADDQRDVLEALRILLKAEGFLSHQVTSPDELLEAVGATDYDVVLIDLNYTRDTTSGSEGLELLERLIELDSELPVVVMTAWASVEVAVEAMRRGARDFVEKPWDNARLVSILRTQIALRRALRRGERLEEENRLLRAEGDESVFIAQAASMRPVVELIERIGPSNANVLITGENGVGKGVVAQRLHRASQRADRPMVTVNAGGLVASVFESELFGHVSGAFTDAREDRVGRFELADGGTLFLDEIANVPLDQQAKLLRVVETGELERVGSSQTRRVDVRLLSATNSDLLAEVEAGRFRRDLYFRLNTVEVHIPTLAERRDDILPLAEYFLERHFATYERSLCAFSAAARQALLHHRWPGNVRQLSHAIERAVLMVSGDEIEVIDLGLEIGEGQGSGTATSTLDELSLEEVERLLIRKALARCSGKVSDAARQLGLSRSALYRRLDKYGL